MLISTSGLTLGFIEHLQRKGYQVEVQADEEYVKVTKAYTPETSQEAVHGVPV